MKTYAAPWKSDTILACKRCQKKLGKSEEAPALARLKKWIKTYRRQQGLKAAPPLHVLDIPCQKICPKNGVVVLTPDHLAARPPRFSIISTAAQMQALYHAATGRGSRE